MLGQGELLKVKYLYGSALSELDKKNKYALSLSILLASTPVFTLIILLRYTWKRAGPARPYLFFLFLLNSEPY